MNYNLLRIYEGMLYHNFEVHKIDRLSNGSVRIWLRRPISGMIEMVVLKPVENK